MDDFNLVVPDGGSQWTNDGQITVASGGMLRLGGNLTTASFSGISNSGTLEIDGTLSLSGGVLSAGPGSTLGNVAIAGTLSGTGIISGTVADLGSITVASGGTIVAAGNVTGSGLLSIGADADLVIDSATSATADFVGADGTLTLNSPASFTGAIAGLSAGDIVELVNTTVTSATISGSTLTIYGVTSAIASYQVSGDLSGEAFAVQGDGVGGTRLVLGSTQPYNDFLVNADTLALDIRNAAPPAQIAADALNTYTAGIAGAIGTFGGPSWEQVYDNSNHAATAVGVDLTSGTSGTQLLHDALGLYDTIVAGAVGSVASGASPAAYDAILNSVGQLATDIVGSAGSSTLAADIGNVYSAIAGAAVTSATWQQAISASDAAASILSADIASSSSARIQNDVAGLYNSIVSGSLNAIGGTSLQQAYGSSGATVVTLGADIVGSASTIQLQRDTAGLYNAVISGIGGSSGQVAFKDYQSAISAINIFGSDVAAGASPDQLYYDGSGVLTAALSGMLGEFVGTGAEQSYDNLASAMVALAQQFDTGTASPGTVVNLYATAKSDFVGFESGATEQAAYTSTTQAAAALENDVTIGASSNHTLADELSLDIEGLGEYGVAQGGASSIAYSAIVTAGNALNSDIESGNSGAISNDVNALIQASKSGDVSAIDGAGWASLSNDVQQPIQVVVDDIAGDAGTSQVMADAASLYDALTEGTITAIGEPDEVFSVFGLLPSTVAADVSNQDASLVLANSQILANELIDPFENCPGMENEPTPPLRQVQNWAADYAGLMAALEGLLFKLQSMVNATQPAPFGQIASAERLILSLGVAAENSALPFAQQLVNFGSARRDGAQLGCDRG